MRGEGPSRTDADAEALESYDEKMRVVEDQVGMVHSGKTKGLLLHGSGGIGKSYVVTQCLEARQVAYQQYNSRITGKGLFRILKEHPDEVHLLEDVERLTDDHDAQGVLRSACWSQPGQERRVTWVTGKDGSDAFVFRGGIIMTANRPLARMPELQALATRICVNHLRFTDAEIAAVMRRIARQGWQRDRWSLEPGKCLEVCNYIIDQCHALGHHPDLRLLDKAALYFLEWEEGKAKCHWQDLVTADIRQGTDRLNHPIATESREEKAERLLDIVRQIRTKKPDRELALDLWEQMSGMSRASYDRYLSKVKAEEQANKAKGANSQILKYSRPRS